MCWIATGTVISRRDPVGCDSIASVPPSDTTRSLRLAGPSFEAFFGRVPPADVDVRALCIAELERRG